MRGAVIKRKGTASIFVTCVNRVPLTIDYPTVLRDRNVDARAAFGIG